jgi:tRNA(fMet)-specific endonuclease VapC
VAYLLDSNVCVIYLNGKSIALRQRLNSTPVAEILVCAVVKGELFYGSRRSNNPTKSRQIQQEFLAQFVSLPFDDAAAVVYGEIRATLASASTPIGPNDLQIAAIALAHDLTLVTHNTREFSRDRRVKTRRLGGVMG